jgi:hypothetical protein
MVLPAPGAPWRDIDAALQEATAGDFIEAVDA